MQELVDGFRDISDMSKELDMLQKADNLKRKCAEQVFFTFNECRSIFPIKIRTPPSVEACYQRLNAYPKNHTVSITLLVYESTRRSTCSETIELIEDILYDFFQSSKMAVAIMNVREAEKDGKNIYFEFCLLENQYIEQIYYDFRAKKRRERENRDNDITPPHDTDF